MALLEIVIATLLISLTSLVGMFLLSKSLKKFMHYFISFAAATLLAVSFFDLIPESLESLMDMGLDLHTGVLFILFGILFFFLMERFIHWHHCNCDGSHKGHHHIHESKKKKPAGILNIVGNILHNFFDGLIVASAFLLDIRLGAVTSVMVLIHEIPHQLGNFSILIHSGYNKKRALLLNFGTALVVVIGGLIGFFAFSAIEPVVPYVIAIAAGGFLYVALSDILPELHQHKLA